MAYGLSAYDQGSNRLLSYLASVMTDRERGLGPQVDFILLGSFVIGIELLEKRLIGCLGESNFLVQQGQNTKGSPLDQIQAILVVFERDGRPVDLLCAVFFLFQLNCANISMSIILVHLIDCEP